MTKKHSKLNDNFIGRTVDIGIIIQYVRGCVLFYVDRFYEANNVRADLGRNVYDASISTDLNF